MKSTTIFAAIFSASITLAAPLPRSNRYNQQQPQEVYSITSFTTHKQIDTNTITTISFNIVSATGGSLNLPCSAYDPSTGHFTDSFEEGKTYSCGEDSTFEFIYTPGAGETLDDFVLWQRISETETWRGSTTPATANEVCKRVDEGVNSWQSNVGAKALQYVQKALPLFPSESGVGDVVCVAPDQMDAFVEMRRS